MATMKEAASGRSDIFHIDPLILRVKDGWNSRDFGNPENREHVNTLAMSIAEEGVKMPLTVYHEGDDIYVSDGHCRLEAVKLAISRGAEIKSVPTMTEPRYANEGDRIFSQILRNSGKPLSQYEQGSVFKRLLAKGFTEHDIARRSGRSVNHVKDCLNLHAAPEPVQEAVRTGEVAATMANKILREAGAEAAVALINDAVASAKADGRTRATLKDVTKRPKAVAPRTNGATRDPKAFWLSATDTKTVRELLVEAYQGGEEGSHTFQLDDEGYDKVRKLLRL